MVKHNNTLPNQHFRKDWQRFVKCWFDQPAKKIKRRAKRAARAKKMAPRPVRSLRPKVRCPTLKYNTRVRQGRGFTIAELRKANIQPRYARTIGISVDLRRKNKSEEAMNANVKRLENYMSRLIIFPAPSKKKTQPKPEIAEGTTIEGVPMPVKQPQPKLDFMDIAAVPEGGAFATLRLARMNAKWKGRREKRARDAEEAAK